MELKMLNSSMVFELQRWRNNQICDWNHGKPSLYFLYYPNMRQPQQGSFSQSLWLLVLQDFSSYAINCAMKDVIKINWLVTRGLVLFPSGKKPSTTLPNTDLLKATFLCPLSWKKKGHLNVESSRANYTLRCSIKKKIIHRKLNWIKHKTLQRWCSYKKKNQAKLKEIGERSKRNRWRVKEELWINFCSIESVQQIKLYKSIARDRKQHKHFQTMLVLYNKCSVKMKGRIYAKHFKTWIPVSFPLMSPL